MPVFLSSVLTAVFVLLCLVGLALSLKQWKTGGQRRWEAVSLTVAFGWMAAFMYLERFDGAHDLSFGSQVAFGATLLSLAWTAAAARARWRKKRKQDLELERR